MAKTANLTNIRFGRLVVLERATNAEKSTRWLCQCDCGHQKIVRSQLLIRGESSSCGCLHKEQLSALKRTHGYSGSRTYKTWLSMKRRCLKPRNKDYHHYGGRGITICQQWQSSFENFLADMGECPEGLTLERIDNNGNYEPSNCRWATQLEQTQNTRRNRYIEYQGQTKTTSAWARELGIRRQTLEDRLNVNAFPLEQIFSSKRLPKGPRGVNRRKRNNHGQFI